MVQKIKDAANILKAKLKKDELEQNLLQATSQQNWQTPTNILHEISNASYNYQKNQQINDFIIDKIKKKTSWRKVLKTLNLVEFLLKNGSPSLVTTYKYDIHYFKALNDYSHVSSQGIDRGESIKEKAKGIVQLLTNQELLEDQRTKAKNIRDKMSGITGAPYSSGYGDSSYSGYDSRTYNKQNSHSSTPYHNNTGNQSYGNSQNYGSSSMNTAYGDYSTNQSTLAKYKDKEKDNKNTKPNITGVYDKKTEQNKPDITQQQPEKKPFQKQARKLVKPGERPVPSIIPSVSNTATVNTSQAAKEEVKKTNLMDDDILGFSEPQQPKQNVVKQPSQQNTFINPAYSATAPLAAQNIQQTQQQQQQQFINPMYGTTAPLAAQNVQQTQQQQFINPMYGTTAPLAAQNIQQTQQQQFINPMYGTTAPLAAQNIQNTQQANHMNFINPMYPTTSPMVAQQNYQNLNLINPMYSQTAPMTQPQPQNWTMNQPQQNPYINPMYPQTSTMIPPQSQPQYKPQQQSQPTMNISLTTKTSTDNDFGSFQSGNTNANANWLSDKQKGLIDFSDFSSQIKKDTKTNNNNSNNNNNKQNISTDWNW